MKNIPGESHGWKLVIYLARRGQVLEFAAKHPKYQIIRPRCLILSWVELPPHKSSKHSTHFKQSQADIFIIINQNRESSLIIQRISISEADIVECIHQPCIPLPTNSVKTNAAANKFFFLATCNWFMCINKSIFRSAEHSGDLKWIWCIWSGKTSSLNIS